MDLIAAEDTRRTRILLSHYAIKTPLTSYHDHNKETKALQLISRLKHGSHLALVSDAGTPGISDPGFFLIKLSLENSIPVVPIPGVSAVITALSISGLPTDSFVFNGFLPTKKSARNRFIKNLKDEERTMVFYESPRRIQNTLSDLLEILGDRDAVVTRELTKVFEEVIRGTIKGMIHEVQTRQLRGEITLLVSGKSALQNENNLPISQLIRNYQEINDLSMRDLASFIAQEENLSRREVYQEILKLRKKNTP